MAFDVDKNNIEKVMSAKVSSVLPRGTDETENRKTFSFTLQPTVKEGLDKLAKEQGYKTTSQFLNDLIKQFI